MAPLVAFALVFSLAACQPARADSPPEAERPALFPAQPSDVPWPTQRWPEAEPGPGVDRALLAAAFDHAFESEGRAGLKNARALLAVQRGAIVAERYAPGFGKDTRFHSWSMAKSITQALVGILVRQGKLGVDAPTDVPEWREAGDPRRALTLDHLLHMTTGLDNGDGFDSGGDGDQGELLVASLMFGPGSQDQAAFAASFPLVHEPNTFWAYSTSTTILIAGILRRQVGGGRDAMLRFMRRELLAPLGMTSGVPEFDASGTFMGGGFFWATARDWARFGTLYLRDGVWDGQRILPEGWVEYSRTRAPADNNGTFGAHLWLTGEPAEGQIGSIPRGPASAFAVAGAMGQFVMMVPSHDLLVVRLGEMQGISWDEAKEPVAEVIDAFPPQPQGLQGAEAPQP